MIHEIDDASKDYIEQEDRGLKCITSVTYSLLLD